MIITFLDPHPNPDNPYAARLFFYTITNFPPQIAEGVLFLNTANGQVVGVQSHELEVTTFEKAIETFIHSLFSRGLLKPFLTHHHNGLTNDLIRTVPNPPVFSNKSLPTL
jgi:hypothetical protein